MADALAWYLALQATALAAWPLVHRAVAGWADGGWTASKTAGLLLLAWLAWLLGMLTPLPYSRGTLALLVAGVAAFGWGRLARRPDAPDLLAWIRERRLQLLAWEALLLAAFAFFAVLRAYDPAVQGTEKPMDMAFLNGFLAAQRLPTQDTWLAGYGVPYYYFGYFTFASLAKLAGVAPGVAYNLAAASVPALAVVGFAGLAWNLARAGGARASLASVAGGLSALFVVFAGNLVGALEGLVARGLLSKEAGPALGIKNFAADVVPGVWPPGGLMWRASRVVPNIQPDGINEVPFFSLLLSDLHPHFVALPFEALALAVAAYALLGGGRHLRSPWSQAAAALALGVLLPLNTWDVAVFWLLYLAAAWLAGAGLPGRERLVRAAFAPAAGVLLFAPYFVGYGGPPLGVGMVEQRTPLASLLVLFGPQLALLALGGVWFRRTLADRRGWLLAGGGALLGTLLALAGEPTLGLLVALLALLLPWPLTQGGRHLQLSSTSSGRQPPVIGDTATGTHTGAELAAGARGARSGEPPIGEALPVDAGPAGAAQPEHVRRRLPDGDPREPGAGIGRGVDPVPRRALAPAEQIVVGLAALSVAILLGVEVVYLRDVFGTRMNTVFKLHYNAWVLAGLAVGAGVALVARCQPSSARRWAVVGVAALALLPGLVYPAATVQARVAGRGPGAPPLTLDGTAFLPPDDAAAVRWLRAQVQAQGTRPVIVEAVGDPYSPAARVATYSGAVAVLGWANHELQWRGPLPELGRRADDVARLYRDADPRAVREILDRYAVRYVVVGDLERQTYGAGVETRFEGVLPVAQRFGRLTLYRAP